MLARLADTVNSCSMTGTSFHPLNRNFARSERCMPSSSSAPPTGIPSISRNEPEDSPRSAASRGVSSPRTSVMRPVYKPSNSPCACLTNAIVSFSQSTIRTCANRPGVGVSATFGYRSSIASRLSAALVTDSAMCSPWVTGVYLALFTLPRRVLDPPTGFTPLAPVPVNLGRGATIASGSRPLNLTSENLSWPASPTLCGVARSHPFVHRSIMSAMIIVNLDRSWYTSASLQFPARSLSSRPGAVWCRMVKHSKSVCSLIPTATTLPPLDRLGGVGVRTLLPARADGSSSSPA